MTFPNPVVQVLTEARSRVEMGWCQGNSRDMYGNFCALAATQRGGRSTQKARVFLGRAIGTWDSDHLATAIVRWNDTPGRTQAEVVAAFDRAIALAEAES